MEHDDSSVPKLATISRRLNIWMIGIFAIAFLLVATSYWAINRVVQDAQDRIHFHFMRLVGDIQEHQGFLTRIARQSDAATQIRDQDVVPLQRRVVGRRDGIEFHEGREFSFAMPFSLTRPEAPLDLSENHGAFSFGVMLANFYSRFWSTSPYPAPQVLIVDLEGQTSLAVPAVGTLPAQDSMTWEHYPNVLSLVRQRLAERPPAKGDPRVHWGRVGHFIEGRQALIGYIATDLPDPLWWKEQSERHVVAVTLLDLDRINDYEQVLDRQVFETLDLVSPEGLVLLGSDPADAGFDEGLNFTRDGVLIKVRSARREGWVARYRVDYQGFFQYAKWQLLGVGVLSLLALGAGWLANRWYARRVIRPADVAHRYLVESDTFSRTIIQTAPVALCVVRRGDLQVMLHNALAEAWLGMPEQIRDMLRELCLFDLGGPGSGACIHVGARYLHASFAPTRYRGEEAMLCVFNDISTHKEAESTLADAKQAADTASEAKTVFLATMSHEIRTPLYGVLGTLELLGRTPLDTRQRGYLETIQGSSATLLQLISDILDVSKIEAGEMVLEPVEFSPLEMVEDVLRSYAGSAAGKGLQLYGCIDPEVPERLLGEATRIRQILNNLLSNALKFTELGRVVLRLRLARRDAEGIDLHWQVTDTGIGIAREQQERLFESFYQVNGNRHTISGTGLGLSICSRLCKLMQGSLQVVSETGLGSSFTLALRLHEVASPAPALPDIHLGAGRVYLRSPVRELAESIGLWLTRWGLQVTDVELQGRPGDAEGVLLELLADERRVLPWAGGRVLALCDANPRPDYTEGAWQVSLHSLRGIAQALQWAMRGATVAPQVAPPAAESGQLGLRVLVAEDNPVNQALLTEQLEALGCMPCMCVDGREALLRFDAAEFDVVLTDLNMPNLDGYELTRALRGRGAGLPIIGVTANALREEVQRGREAGMNAWLVKPMSLQALHECLERVAGRRLAVDAEALPVAPAAAGELQIPERMRQLFIDTMLEDLVETRRAFDQGNLAEVRQRVHRMRGSLAVVQAGALEIACGEVEDILLGGAPGVATAELVTALLVRIQAALDNQ